MYYTSSLYNILRLIIVVSVLKCSHSFQNKMTNPTIRIQKYQSKSRSALYTKIALTREIGANDKLVSLLQSYDTYEIPCIMFADGEDTSKLPDAISKYDIIIITSPQAALVFIESWKTAGKPMNLKIATVGKGSSKPLIAEGIKPVFEPSDSTGEILAAELPIFLGKTVLYPSSSLAENTLALGLEKRGFKVFICIYENISICCRELFLHRNFYLKCALYFFFRINLLRY